MRRDLELRAYIGPCEISCRSRSSELRHRNVMRCALIDYGGQGAHWFRITAYRHCKIKKVRLHFFALLGKAAEKLRLSQGQVEARLYFVCSVRQTGLGPPFRVAFTQRWPSEQVRRYCRRWRLCICMCMCMFYMCMYMGEGGGGYV